MRIFISLCLVIFNLPLSGKEQPEPDPTVTTTKKQQRFYPNITTAAMTNGPWKLSYETFPGASGLSAWPYNSLSIGIGTRFQVGTTPLFYAVKEHKSNINVKWNFYQGEQLYIAIGITSVKWALPTGIEVIESDGNTTYIDELSLSTGGLSLNYFFKNSKFAIGFNLNYSDITTGSNALDTQLKGDDNELPIEWLMDVSMTFSPFVITLGIGETRASAFDFSDNPRPFGFGASLIYLRNTNWFPHFGIGCYFIPDSKKGTLLLYFGI